MLWIEYEALFEVKYLKKKEYEDKKIGETALQEKIQEAKTQLEQYQQVEELREKTHLKKWILVFSGSTCVYLEELT